jgi:hypothetical protein
MRDALIPLVLCLCLVGGCRKPEVQSAPLAGAASRVGFRDVAVEAGLDFRWGNGDKHPLNILEIMGAGAGFLDFDGDGWLDVVFLGPPGCALYRSEGGTRFRNVTAGSGLDRLKGRWHGCATADYDNDGRVDLFLSGYRQKVLLRNLGEGRFAAVSVPGLDTKTWGSACSFLNANGDAYPDLVVGNYVTFGPGSPEFINRNGVMITLGPDAYQGEKPQLFLNRGGKRFEDATARSGVRVSRGRCLGMAVADYDDDGDDDFYIANDEMPGNLFENDGSGRLTDVGLASGTALSVTGKRLGGMGVTWGDYDSNGRLDLQVTTFTQEPKSLYRSDGGGMFTERSYEAGISQSMLRWVGFGVAFFDADHDGKDDLAIASGHVEDLIKQVDPLNDYPQPLAFFHNQGNGMFADATEQAGPGFQKRIVGRALAAGDYDNDGDVDLLIADLEGAPLLLRNEKGSQAGNWLTLHLEGTRSNRMALGARVTLKTAAGSQTREVRTDGSYLAARDPRLHFGLGSAATVEEILIRWPSGTRQRLSGIPANQILKVTEAATD